MRFFFPLVLHRVRTAFRVFLGNFVQMEKLRLYGASACLVLEQDYEPDKQDYGSSMCAAYKVTTLRQTAAEGNCPQEQKWHLELGWRCDGGKGQWQPARGVWHFTAKVVQPYGCTGIYLPGSGQTCYALSQEVMGRVWG